VKSLRSRIWLRIGVSSLALLSACSRRHERVVEIDYVSAPEVTLRDQLAQVFNKVGTANNGERVEVLDRERRFAKVRTKDGAEGWVEQRYLVNQQVFNSFQKLAQDEKDAAVEGTATTRNDTNLHGEPGRDTERLYQLAQSAKVSLLKRATAEKALPGEGLRPVSSEGGKTIARAMEDWWLRMVTWDGF
jgi:uncharacterized protein YgiM (DUF1202 family)